MGTVIDLGARGQGRHFLSTGTDRPRWLLFALSRRNPLEQVVTAVQTVDDRVVMWMATVDHRRIRRVLVAAARAGDVLAPPLTSSLPAGHTGSVAAFSVATGRSVPRLRGWLAASTVLLAYSHVYTGRHYLSDVVIGAVVGVSVGGLCRRPSGGPAAQRHAVRLRSGRQASATRACG
jgi:membrane-associated phospholipid phosphatase